MIQTLTTLLSSLLYLVGGLLFLTLTAFISTIVSAVFLLSYIVEALKLEEIFRHCMCVVESFDWSFFSVKKLSTQDKVLVRGNTSITSSPIVITGYYLILIGTALDFRAVIPVYGKRYLDVHIGYCLLDHANNRPLDEKLVDTKGELVATWFIRDAKKELSLVVPIVCSIAIEPART